MTAPLDFQSIIMSLQRYWADQGCLIWQPYYAQVGAGTWNPATFLRAIGPEPWNVAYVEPSVRPDDGRYGDNPNRLQQHTQFQVILKPDPGDPQEMYLRSLEAIGVDVRNHDIRFVEDNWEAPPLGAWGLGWQVWLDGQEITQFTYFQQAGGLDLDPVSVEITYGLERIAMTLQRARHVADVRWNEGRTWGDIHLQGEREHSTYYFEVAEVERLRHMYDLFEAEAKEALKAGLVLPAYDSLLKCSHTFNVLDTRGAVGVTERQAYFARMRRLASGVAELYLEKRQREEFPWLDASGDGGADGRPAAARGKAKGKKAKISLPTSPAAFLLEIGTEELPAGDLDAAIEQLRRRFPALLDDLRLERGGMRVLGTPRRLVVAVEALAPRQPDVEQVVKGPPASRAFGADGAPTRAAEGFAQSRGVSVRDLQVREMDGGRYAAAVVKEEGRSAVEALAERLPEVIAGLRFDRSMRWNSSNVAFSRPIRWLLALHGEQVIPFEFAGLQSGNATRGLRFSQPELFAVKDAADYFSRLKAQGIIVDQDARREAVRRQIEKLAAEVGGEVPDDPELMTLSTHQAEAPTAVRGAFDQEFLELPGPVLISVMKKHQNYFPVRKDGELLPYFITVGNGDWQDRELVARGNADVVRARFEDARFFITEDAKRPLAAYLPDLEALVFQGDLGSMLDKSGRVTRLVDGLAEALALDEGQAVAAHRAAELCKADLVTKMVVEMTSLQGVMGRYYALKSGEPQAVAEAIYEHYLPRFSGDETPKTKPGLAVGLADRLDSLAGLFAAGLAPTSAKDPFAQRRAALGLVHNLIEWGLDFDLRAALDSAAGNLPIEASDASRQECLAFVVERARNLFLELGRRYDVVDAVLAAQGHNPAGAARAIEGLSAWVERDDWDTILPAYSRCVRITRDQGQRFEVEPKVFAEKAEKVLFKALEKAEAAERAPGSVDDFLQAFTPMIPAIDKFFEDVLVMSEDEALQQNRLGLLQRIAALAEGVADLSRLEGF